jgi:hypothetical protein
MYHTSAHPNVLDPAFRQPHGWNRRLILICSGPRSAAGCATRRKTVLHFSMRSRVVCSAAPIKGPKNLFRFNQSFTCDLSDCPFIRTTCVTCVKFSKAAETTMLYLLKTTVQGVEGMRFEPCSHALAKLYDRQAFAPIFFARAVSFRALSETS